MASQPSLRSRPPLVIRPPAREWPRLLRRRTDGRAVQMRRELGIPTDRPIVMTGHQAAFWHPGILAKYLGADALAAATGAAAAWIVVDQDEPQSSVRYPVIHADGRLEVRTLGLEGGRSPPRAEAREAAGPPPFVASGLESIRHALENHAAEPSPARRIAAAAADLMAPLLSSAGRDAPLVMATALSRTSLFRELAARMARDPEACILPYNAGAARHPAAGVRPLHADPVQDRWELPLWRLGRVGGAGGRRHVYAEDLPSIPLAELAPKALFMTGLLRLGGCDLFIHGTGGGGGEPSAGAAGDGGYDRITEEWLAAWLGEDAADLAPIAVISATLRLPVDVPPPPTPAEAARTVWLAHRARHNPGVIGDKPHEEQRRAVLGELNAAARPLRARYFRDLHLVLDGYRRARSQELARLEAAAAAARSRLSDGPILEDRTWAFPLHPPEALRDLGAAVAAALEDHRGRREGPDRAVESRRPQR
jgi:hypothetical protein